MTDDRDAPYSTYVEIEVRFLCQRAASGGGSTVGRLLLPLYRLYQYLYSTVRMSKYVISSGYHVRQYHGSHNTPQQGSAPACTAYCSSSIEPGARNKIKQN
jgi:hypothetical protein